MPRNQEEIKLDKKRIIRMMMGNKMLKWRRKQKYEREY